MHVNLIVAVGKNMEIGRNGDLIWHIPDDLKHFKVITMGHPVIMGRKTWESLPRKPLPGRKNVILTRSSDYSAPDAVIATSVEEALKETYGESPFIMGGGEIYSSFLPYVNRIYITEVDETCDDADVFLKLDLNNKEWKCIEYSDWHMTEKGIKYRYLTYEKIND